MKPVHYEEGEGVIAGRRHKVRIASEEDLMRDPLILATAVPRRCPYGWAELWPWKPRL